MSVLFFAETSNGQFKKQIFEAATYAKKLAQMLSVDVYALCIGETKDASQLAEYGIEKIKLAAPNQNTFDAQTYAHIIKEAANQCQATTIICSHTANANSYAAYLSVLWDADMVSMANSLPESADSFVVRKDVFAGKASAHIDLQGHRKVISVAGNSIGVDPSPVAADVSNMDINVDKGRTKVIKVDTVEGVVPLPEAEVVVSGGRGFKGPENWHLLLDLAESLGATTACSRPVADSDWRPHHEHVGQTGVTIRPNLYIAVGISGAIQHLGGVNNSKVIVVINNDPEAPFFKAADYGVCADLFDVLPKLTAEINQFKSNN